MFVERERFSSTSRQFASEILDCWKHINTLGEVREVRMSTERDGKGTVSLREAVEVIKSSRADVPAYVRVISEQNRAIREARREIPSATPRKPKGR